MAAEQKVGSESSKHRFTSDERGLSVHMFDKRASCFCLTAALQVCARELQVSPGATFRTAIKLLRSQLLRSQYLSSLWDTSVPSRQDAIAAKLRAA